jgi:hypothetical protein
MSISPFDPSQAVSFDLAHGHVEVGDGPRRVLVPAEALVALGRAAGEEATGAFARALGEPAGRRLAARIGDAAAAPLDALVDHLGGELAVLGLGSLGLERWGRALVLTVDHGPLGAEGDALLAAVLAAALGAATGREVRCATLSRDGERARFVVTGAAGAEKVAAWQRDGVAWGDILVRLHAPAAVGGDA